MIGHFPDWKSLERKAFLDCYRLESWDMIYSYFEISLNQQYSFFLRQLHYKAVQTLKDSASLLVCTQKNCLVGSCRFWGFAVSDVISKVVF